ncbi:hypothetical protein HDV05_001576, partial [Chytridiales sp. JEL 0842]
MVVFQRIIPAVNFFIATSALGFQTMVLYPWHEQLERDFQELEKFQHQKLEEFHMLNLKRLDDIESNLEK